MVWIWKNNNEMERNEIGWNEFNTIPPLTFNFVNLFFKISKQWNEIFILFRSILFHSTLFRSAPFYYIPSTQTEPKRSIMNFVSRCRVLNWVSQDWGLKPQPSDLSRDRPKPIMKSIINLFKWYVFYVSFFGGNLSTLNDDSNFISRTW